MELNISIPFKIDGHKIIPVFETIKVGRKKQDVFRRIEYKINGKPFGQIKGVLSKKDIKETFPMLEAMNIDVYTSVLDSIICQIIININDIFGTELTHQDLGGFLKENEDVFNEFITELKNTVSKYQNEEIK